jgi:hypothetical protein
VPFLAFLNSARSGLLASTIGNASRLSFTIMSNDIPVRAHDIIGVDLDPLGVAHSRTASLMSMVMVLWQTGHAHMK